MRKYLLKTYSGWTSITIFTVFWVGSLVISFNLQEGIYRSISVGIFCSFTAVLFVTVLIDLLYEHHKSEQKKLLEKPSLIALMQNLIALAVTANSEFSAYESPSGVQLGSFGKGFSGPSREVKRAFTEFGESIIEAEETQMSGTVFNQCGNWLEKTEWNREQIQKTLLPRFLEIFDDNELNQLLVDWDEKHTDLINQRISDEIIRVGGVKSRIGELLNISGEIYAYIHDKLDNTLE